MIKFTAIISKCQYSSFGLLHLLKKTHDNERVVLFSEIDELYEWRKRVVGEVLFKVYMIIPSAMRENNYLYNQLKACESLKEECFTEKIILNADKALSKQYKHMCSKFGWLPIDIYSKKCAEIAKSINCC
ncbi:hypothetical protein GTGU_02665 [Trabulsiella guamensis ATCC 49490]|uniref:Uncharacterized protein n=1 Tax=Trabulsiella guamensis ATCC 49490 TaxID=1005994 RepID=A0A085A7F3_9ENTR|nr:hypothetical protein [Trabulsiella guamensis]KFC06148.1 hypothetical protein GTGU_02665 [Trabulsiella guamensis ATCC 49490]